MTWLVVALVVIALIAGGAYMMMEKQRSAALQRRFGPEYDRALGESGGDRRAAEARLRARLARRDELEVRELDVPEREGFAARWQAVQVAFVDDPAGAVRQAEALVEEVVGARGYVSSEPRGDVDADGEDRDGDGVPDRYELLAVDHPALVERYRTAREAEGAGGIDDLREAFLHHRALFEALMADGHVDADANAARRVRSQEPEAVAS